MRVALKIEYDGTNYCGWQSQQNGDTVQSEIERALMGVLGEQVRIYGSGRTDAGVHALGQVAHFDTESKIPPERFAYAINQKLPGDICIKESFVVASDFHARFCANGKHYRYIILNAAQRSALQRGRCMHVPKSLDIQKMSRAAKYFLGEHDFASLCAANSSVKDTVRNIYSVEVGFLGEYINIDVQGNGFLYNMVRIIAGTLIEVGHGKRLPESIPAMLEKKDRSAAGATAKACGLYLVEVFYEI